MQLTERDKALMVWINKLGFVTNELIAKHWHVSIKTSYGRIKQLVDVGYLSHRRVFHGAPGVYTVKRQGVYLSNSPLPPLNKIPLTTYCHDLTVAELSLRLTEQLGGHFISERELRQEHGVRPLNHRFHISDGTFVFADKRIAIEVELNKKSKKRREAIFSHYLKQTEVNAVWYFCNHVEVMNQLEPYAKRSQRFVIYPLNAKLEASQV